ncbi:MAG TPA: type II secretion system protein GspG [Candidatus Babeliales bacterium]|nr:type II secretion system protein GspG [Candidatus Babeliales bacterium]
MAIALKNTRSGFTLMELMIVIMIIGLLGGVLAPAVNNALKKAKKGTCKTMLLNLKIGISRYQGEVGQMPATLKDLIKKPSGERVKKWDGPYYGEEGIDAVPEDPWSNKFHYKITPPPAKHPYELLSYGPNGKGSPKDEWISVWD